MYYSVACIFGEILWLHVRVKSKQSTEIRHNFLPFCGTSTKFFFTLDTMLHDTLVRNLDIRVSFFFFLKYEGEDKNFASITCNQKGSLTKFIEVKKKIPRIEVKKSKYMTSTNKNISSLRIFLKVWSLNKKKVHLILFDIIRSVAEFFRIIRLPV